MQTAYSKILRKRSMLHFKLKSIAFITFVFFIFLSFPNINALAQDTTGDLSTQSGSGGGSDLTITQTHGGNQLTNTQDLGQDTTSKYVLLEPIGDFTEFNTDDPCPFVKYLNIVIKIFLGICAVLAMIMIIAGGLQYMTSELPSFKEDGKSKITNAVIGFIMALAAYAFLNTLNPKLLNMCPHIPKAIINIGPAQEGTGTYEAISKESLESLGIQCPGSGGTAALAQIAKSFIGKVTYSNAKRGTLDTGIPTVYLDCSSFVKQVYACAGLSLGGDNTATMFPGQEGVNSLSGNSVNGVDLKVGDLLGWMKGESSKYPTAGHIVMYIGNGQYIEVHGGSGSNNAVGINSVGHYGSSYNYIIRN